MTKALVTGGAGFLGSNLCRLLINKGYEVHCMDNLYTGSATNVQDLLDLPNFYFHQHDVTEPYDINVDEIYNMACPASPPHYQKNSIKTLMTSIRGVNNALELAERYDSKLLQASTSEVYGNPLVHPQPETYWGNVNPIGIRSCYDEGKRVAETMMMDYYRTYNTKIKIVRIFNTYGPGMNPNDGRVVSNFIVQAIKNEDITIYGDGTQTRSFCYVDDLIEGIYKMMQTDANVIGPINLGNPSEHTVSELATLIINLLNSKSKITYCPLPKDDPLMREPDITVAKNTLGWSPKIDIESGIIKTAEYFKKILFE